MAWGKGERGPGPAIGHVTFVVRGLRSIFRAVVHGAAELPDETVEPLDAPSLGPAMTETNAPAVADLDAPAERTWNADQDRALRVWVTLARCYTTFGRAVAAKVAEYDLTVPQFGILEALHHLGPLSLGELAGKLLVTGGNVTYIMDRLEDEGLVTRERSGEDRRVVEGRLTPEGRALVEDVFPGHVEFIDELVDALEPREQDELRRLLKKLGRSVVVGEG